MFGRALRIWLKRCALLTCLGAAALGAAKTARADEAQTQAADALYRQARTSMARGQLTEACEKFAASHALEPGLGTLLHLGDCYERTGRFASAFETFGAAEALASEREDTARERLARVRAKALMPRVPKLEVRSSKDAPAGLQITINGTPLGAEELDRPLWKDEGRYEIRFSAPGYEAFTAAVELRNGADETAVVTAPRLVRTARPATLRPPVSSLPAERPTGSGQRAAAWVIGGAGVALAAAAGVFTVFAASKNEDSKRFCDRADSSRCGPEGVSLREDAQNMALAATITGVAGGLALASGLVVYVTAPASERGIPTAARLMLQGSF